MLCCAVGLQEGTACSDVLKILLSCFMMFHDSAFYT